MTASLDSRREARVAVRAVEPADYGEEPRATERMATALDELGGALGWRDAERGPFGAVIPRGARVLVKPNWVLHRNYAPHGLAPLLTHASLVRAAVEAALRTDASAVTAGDAPIQGCNFEALLEHTGLGAWATSLGTREPRFRGIQDFRRTKSVYRDGIRDAAEGLRPLEDFVLFDLGADSLLEPISSRPGAFRVTQYDPDQMARTHREGKHQYLIARAVIEADVVINLPKLKTHKKAGVTCALKNLIGINGNKEFLPHHRVGGSAAGGDCYPGRSRVKRALEFALDRQNQARHRSTKWGWHQAVRVFQRMAHAQGDVLGVEGSWSGNDTIWRTCLDLNRILIYGRADGTLADEPQRTVLNVVDAVVAGQGDGPLAPQPLPLGVLLAGASSTAIDWVGARLLGYDPALIPIAREAFGNFRWPLVRFAPGDVTVTGALGEGAADRLVHAPSGDVVYPAGWMDAVSRETHASRARAESPPYPLTSDDAEAARRSS